MQFIYIIFIYSHSFIINSVDNTPHWHSTKVSLETYPLYSNFTSLFTDDIEELIVKFSKSFQEYIYTNGDHIFITLTVHESLILIEKLFPLRFIREFIQLGELKEFKKSHNSYQRNDR